MNENEISVKQPPRLFSKTQKILAELEANLNGPLLCYWNSNGGSICRNDVLALYRILEHVRVQSIAETLNSGYPTHSYPILTKEARRIGLNARELDKPVNDLLLALNACYSEMGQRAVTDFDDTRSHSNEILNILEARNVQVFYQNDKEWFYRTEERRWLTLNDNSNWHVTESIKGKVQHSILHLS